MVVLVTGGAHRIGREISLTLAKKGRNVAIHYKNSQKDASLLAKEINSMGKGKAQIYFADLNDPMSFRQLINDVSRVGCLEHIVNNASTFQHDTLSTVTSQTFDDIIAINLKAPLFLSKEFVEYHRNLSSCEKDASVFPSITNILDQKVASTNADHISYTIAKHGLHNLTEMLARECAPLLRVNAVAPGPVLPHTEQSLSSFQKAQDRCPLKRSPSAVDVAEAVCFLVSAKSVTGQTIYVDSGDRFISRSVDTIQ